MSVTPLLMVEESVFCEKLMSSRFPLLMFHVSQWLKEIESLLVPDIHHHDSNDTIFAIFFTFITKKVM